MPKTPQTKGIIIERMIFLVVIGALSLPQIVSFFAPPVTKVEQNSPCLDEHRAEPPKKKESEKVVAPRSLEDAENLRPSRVRSSANPLPRDASPTRNASTARYTAPRLPMDEQDPTLEEEIESPSWEEQEAQEQYLQEVEAMEEMLQRDFDPTAVPPQLTAEQVAAVEEEIQERILQEESLQPMLQDIQSEEYGNESMSPVR
jgi:hypothetical protein